jgi:amidohydrolase
MIDAELKNKIQSHTAQDLPYLEALFKHYHSHPETGMETFETANRQEQELQALGCGTGRKAQTGVVGILEGNAPGPTVLYRADMDALDMQDECGLPWASQNPGKAHTCGHAMVSTILIGVARNLANLRDQWRGKVMIIAQPGEEGYDGSGKMLADGLYRDFGRPDYGLAYHMSPTLPVGTLGVVKGRALALAQFVDIWIYGVGGHGGNPHTAIDPVVLAASIIMRIQTVVSREISPLEPAVVTVGSINGGTKHSIIPEEVHLRLTIRCFSIAIYEQIIGAIARICDAEAMASALPKDKYPHIEERPFLTDPLNNDPALTERIERVFVQMQGEKQVVQEEPYTFGEDFSSFGLRGEIPISLVWLGAVDPQKFDSNGQPKGFLPGLHHPKFAPDLRAIPVGVNNMTAAIVNLLNEG